MKRRATYRFFAANLLAVLVLNAIVLKEAHHLFGHDHHEAAHCFTFGAEKHLHSEEYAAPDCNLCFFHLAPAQLNDPRLLIFPPSLPVFSSRFSYLPLAIQQIKTEVFLRGPPAPWS